MAPQTNIHRSDALVFFGATGDLAFEQIFPALQALLKHGRLAIPIVAAGRKELHLVYFRAANPLIERSLNGEQVESIQSHMLETIACLAMDLPTEAGRGGLRGARTTLRDQPPCLD
jgi:glucose-6-phosphate 1-dehydrogenase